jgi:hypothetical protein
MVDATEEATRQAEEYKAEANTNFKGGRDRSHGMGGRGHV